MPNYNIPTLDLQIIQENVPETNPDKTEEFESQTEPISNAAPTLKPTILNDMTIEEVESILEPESVPVEKLAPEEDSVQVEKIISSESPATNEVNQVS